MRPARLLLVVCAALLGGCGPVMSLYPLVGANDAVEVAGVEGRWRDADGATCDVVREGTAYRFTWRGESDTARVDVRFVRAGGGLLADIASTGPDDGLAVPAHYVARARVSADSLRLELLDEDWVKSHRGPFWHRVRTADPGGTLVITEPTPGLRRFAARALRAEGAFTAWMDMGRER